MQLGAVEIIIIFTSNRNTKQIIEQKNQEDASTFTYLFDTNGLTI
jgi:hypothetical protein